MPGSVSHACLHEYADTRGACGVREGRLRCMPREGIDTRPTHMPRARIYLDRETRVRAYSSTRTRLVWKYAVCVLHNMCSILDRTCCPRRATAPQSKPPLLSFSSSPSPPDPSPSRSRRLAKTGVLPRSFSLVPSFRLLSRSHPHPHIPG
jgi:hypothetical protein